MKFVHAADLHLDSPFKGLASKPDAPAGVLTRATQDATKRLVDLCLAERADLLLIAGDIFDRDWSSYQTGRFLVEQLDRLDQAGIHTVLLRGNHDAAAHQRKTLRWPARVHWLSESKPQTVTFEDLGVAVHGQGFAQQTELKDLTEQYPPALPKLLNIGLLHTALEGDSDHAHYAPTTVGRLRALSYDYWALGHVHQRRCVARDPWIYYPGNLQGRHARETGPKGCLVVEVEHGRISQEPRFEALDVIRWEFLSLQVSEGSGLEGAIESASTALREAYAASGRPTDHPWFFARLEFELSGAELRHFVNDPDRWHSELLIEAKRLRNIWIERVVAKPAAASPDSGQLDEETIAELQALVEDPNFMEQTWTELGKELGANNLRTLLPEIAHLVMKSTEHQESNSDAGPRETRETIVNDALRLLGDGEATT